jgi:hypothetical protein
MMKNSITFFFSFRLSSITNLLEFKKCINDSGMAIYLPAASKRTMNFDCNIHNESLPFYFLLHLFLPIEIEDYFIMERE